jgi:hypothetical protein
MLSSGLPHRKQMALSLGYWSLQWAHAFIGRAILTEAAASF